MKVYWGRREGKKHEFPGDLNARQVKALRDMLNISNWFCDVILERKSE